MTDEWFVSRVGNRKLSSFKVSKASVYVGWWYHTNIYLYIYNIMGNNYMLSLRHRAPPRRPISSMKESFLYNCFICFTFCRAVDSCELRPGKEKKELDWKRGKSTQITYKPSCNPIKPPVLMVNPPVTWRVSQLTTGESCQGGVTSKPKPQTAHRLAGMGCRHGTNHSHTRHMFTIITVISGQCGHL